LWVFHIHLPIISPWGFTRALFIAVQDDILHTVDQVSDALQAILRHRIEAKLDHPWGRPAGNATNQDGDGHIGVYD
jgi:hypothetical protein